MESATVLRFALFNFSIVFKIAKEKGGTHEGTHSNMFYIWIE
jgi:hypothetical protein